MNTTLAAIAAWLQKQLPPTLQHHYLTKPNREPTHNFFQTPPHRQEYPTHTHRAYRQYTLTLNPTQDHLHLTLWTTYNDRLNRKPFARQDKEYELANPTLTERLTQDILNHYQAPWEPPEPTHLPHSDYNPIEHLAQATLDPTLLDNPQEGEIKEWTNPTS